MSNTNLTTSQIETKINKLFIKLEFTKKGADNFNFKSLYHEDADQREIYDRLHGEDLAEIAKIEKQIIRALFAKGDGWEVMGHIDAGTFPRFAIQAAFNRL